MSNFTQFVQTEQLIYTKFKAAGLAAQQTGFEQDPAITKEIGGLGVITRHPAISEKLTALTNKLSQLVTCLAYDQENEHSTFCVQDKPAFTFAASDHDPILNDLASIVSSALANISAAQKKDCVVDYGRPLYNKNTVIIPGKPRPGYVDLLLTISNAAQRITNMRPSWGTHITAIRFLRPHSPTEIEDFCEFIEKQATALGENILGTIDVCWFKLSQNSFQLSPHRRFSF